MTIPNTRSLDPSTYQGVFFALQSLCDLMLEVDQRWVDQQISTMTSSFFWRPRAEDSGQVLGRENRDNQHKILRNVFFSHSEMWHRMCGNGVSSSLLELFVVISIDI